MAWVGRVNMVLLSFIQKLNSSYLHFLATHAACSYSGKINSWTELQSCLLSNGDNKQCPAVTEIQLVHVAVYRLDSWHWQNNNCISRWCTRWQLCRPVGHREQFTPVCGDRTAICRWATSHHHTFQQELHQACR